MDGLFYCKQGALGISNYINMPKITIRPIAPKKRFIGIDKIIKAEQRKEAKAVKREFGLTVRTWNKKPDFEIDETGENVEVKTDDKIYGYVDKGTRPHIIKPKKPGYPLRFNSQGFKPKTVSNSIYARAGRAAQPPQIRAMQVKHPGFVGRFFTVQLAKRSRARFKRNIDKALKKWNQAK